MMTGRYADIIVDISHENVDRPFQYRIPDSLRDKLETGMRIVVPFGGGNREVEGYVIGITDRAKCAEDKMKEILRISDGDIPIEGIQIKMAAWLRYQYGSTMITALKTVLPARKRTRGLQSRRICLKASEREARELLKKCRVRKTQAARARLLERLCEEGELSYERALRELAVSPGVIHTLEKNGILTVVSEDRYRDPISHAAPTPDGEEKRLVLSGEQQRIVRDVLADYDAGKPDRYLVHGITGSGKTEVYMELIAGMLARGRQAIVLIPEIALTYQTVARFTARFGKRVSVLHSRLSAGEKYDQCERAKKGEIDIIIGPRSALFTPFPRLGLIVIDEEHEASYKSETAPRYHAREAAAELAGYFGASLVLGSATPSLESYYAAQQGRLRKYELSRRLTGGELAKVYVEDMREELKSGNRSIFSRRLLQLLAKRLEAGEQSMLFLNRRGYAGFVSCRACGHVMKCPHCDVSLSEHGGGRLVCHYCGYEQPAVKRCPACGSKYILGFRAGTEQVEEQIRRLFPQARTLRMDADTTRRKDSHEVILTSFLGGKADILIGTQMIVKGHDFPDVTLVGILAADLSLHAGDYRAGERTFQLLTQAAGRAGRGEKPGEVVIQTYQPEHHAVRYAAAQDYKGFYEEEMAYRRLLSYPPAAHMMAVLVLSKEEEAGMSLAGELAQRAAGVCGEGALHIIGPAPAAISRIGDRYRAVFYARSGSAKTLIAAREALEELLERKRPQTETVQFDFDPMSRY